MSIEALSHPTMSLFQSKDGTYYHAKGDYRINNYVPANRTYVRATSSDRANGYTKNLVVHEDVDSAFETRDSERVINASGQNLLYAEGDVWYETTDVDGCEVSPEARFLVEAIRKDTPYLVGVFGSHRVGLNKPSSDIDLICYTTDRYEAISSITDSLARYGVTAETEEQRALQADKYQKRLGITPLQAKYLAEKRNRYKTAEGKKVSLQVMLDVYRPILDTIGALESSWESQKVCFDACIVDARYSWNNPRQWLLKTTDLVIPAVSFYWEHQGMADDSIDHGLYRVKGTKISNSQGEFILLKNNTDYILPKNL